MGHWWDDTDKEKAKYAEGNLSRYRLFHYKSYKDWPGTESGPPSLEASDKQPEPCHGQMVEKW
jgi:hypothetical protein